MNIKIIFLFLVTFIIVGFSNKQAFKNEEKIGHVTYKVNLYPFEVPTANKPISKEMKESIEKTKQEYETMKFHLFFTKNESLYEIEEGIYNEKNDDIDVKFAYIMAGGLCYKNNLTKEKIEQIESFNEIFNVIKPYDEYQWEITSETKMINGFKCYKATCVKEEYDEIRKITRRFTPIAWFAPEIPAPYGPKGYDGLPGLVLEATFNGRLYYYATNINLDFKGKTEITKPKKGTYVTEKEFLKIDAESFRKNIGE